MTDRRRQMRSAQVSRALFALAAVILGGLTAVHFADGADLTGALSGFSAVLFAASAVMATLRIGSLRRTAATAAETEQLERARGGFRLVAAPAPRPAVDVSMILDRDAAWNEACHYQDATWKPDRIAAGVIRVIPRTAERPSWLLHSPVITSWTVVTRAPSHGEGIDLLKAAEPLLRERLAGLADGGVRYFRFIDGALAEVLDGPARDAETGEKLPVYVVGTPKAAVAQPDTGAVRLDPRWEWKLVQAHGMPDRYVKVRCLHTEVEPVGSADGKRTLAQLCLTCDTQFPAPVEQLPADWNP